MRSALRRIAILVLLVLAPGVGARAVDQPSGPAKAFGAANDAWERGDYIAALADYLRVLDSPEGATYIDAIALQTGELYQSFELTADGRNPRFSPDGRYIAYETGLEVSRRTRIVRNDASLVQVADLPGVGVAFSPTGPIAAYLKVTETPELRAATQALEAATLTAPNRGTLTQALAWHVLENSSIAVVDLNSRVERGIATPGLLKTGLAFSADGRSLYFLGRPEAELDRNDIYSVVLDSTAGGQPTIVGDGPRFKGAPVVDPSGKVVLYVVAGADLLRRPASVPPPSGTPAAVAPSPAPPAPPSFALIELASGKTTAIEGSAPTLSSDGRSLAYITRTGTENTLMAGAPVGPMTAVKRTNTRLEAPALSADGGRIAYQSMTRDDWEIFVMDRDGRNETRLTRDPQHDLLPQFLAGDRLLEVVGEPRHRRSFVYDLKTGLPMRLFHNNTIRTIAPEYLWVASRDGMKILIAAERDGNTVSPARGVYLMDLGQKVTKPSLLQRLQASLAGEQALRAAQTKAFGPISAEVRAVVNDVSVSRIYAYEKALFDFDSKNIARPGNRLASEYLFNTYRSFGYEPQLQWFEVRQALGGRTANVLATLPGTVNPELVYVVSSHYDSVTAGPGADDDSSGTAALLEAARVLASHPQPATIVFASFTGEESGLLGSREFVRQAVANQMQVVGALNNDMIGWANDARLDNTIRYSNPGIRDIQHGAAMLFTRLITYDALYFKGTDAMSYYDAYGDIVGGIGSHPVLSNPHYHQAHDLLEFENHELIAETSKTTVATLMRLASSPSRVKGLKVENSTGDTATVSWEASPEKGIGSYAVSISAPAAPGAAPAAAAARVVTVTVPRATVPRLAPGTVVSVTAVNTRGLESWDAARVTVGAPR
jgi:Tol biopolymer transport system component